MQQREEYVLDFSQTKSVWQMHEILREAFDWPESYGYNWDAFWDLLTELLTRPLWIKVLGWEKLSKYLEKDWEAFSEILGEFYHYGEDRYAHLIRIDLIGEDGRITPLFD